MGGLALRVLCRCSTGLIIDRQGIYSYVHSGGLSMACYYAETAEVVVGATGASNRYGQLAVH